MLSKGNLAPADLPKDAASFDLPIALGILAASGTVNPGSLAGCTVVGELGLDGAVRHVPGILPVALGARKRHGGTLIVPHANTTLSLTSTPERLRAAANPCMRPNRTRSRAARGTQHRQKLDRYFSPFSGPIVDT